MQSLLLGYLTVLVLLTGAIAAFCLRVVPRSERWVVERFGSKIRVLMPGLNAVVPFAERVRKRVDVTERALEIRDPDLLTKDEVALGLDVTAFLRVSDPVKACYAVADLYRAADVLLRTNLRSAVRAMTADAILAQPARVEESLLAVLNEGLAQWGALLTAFHIDRVGPSYPRYRVAQTSETTKLITLVVPGFLEDELLVEVEGHKLIIRGNKRDEDVAGFPAECRSFERRFQLGEQVEVRGARLTCGLLEIELQRKGASGAARNKVGISGTLSQPLEPKITRAA